MAKKKNLSFSKSQKAYQNLLGKILERIHQAQYQALKVVNQELISLYWDIGKMILQKQESQKWGKSIVQNIADDLRGVHYVLTGN